jgi:hypothetical protein
VAICAAAALVAAPAAGDAPPGFIGVYSEDLTATDAGATAAAQHGAGVQTVRLPFMWSSIEVAPGVYDFAHYDAVVRAAAAAGMTVLPTLLDAPSFRSARPPGTTRISPPTLPADLGVFAVVLVQRYGAGGTFWALHPDLSPAPIRAWQVWNEPNLPFFWAGDPDPAGYAALLKATAAAIRAADPGAEVVSAGLPDSDVGMPFEEYLAGLYAAGWRSAFDSFAIHAYSPSATGTLEFVRYVRQLIDAYGDATKPIWITEFGWATDGPVTAFTTDEDNQARLVGDAVRGLIADRASLGLRGLVYFDWRDHALLPGQDDQWPYHTGLLRAGGGAKPALEAFRAAAATLRDAPIANVPASTAARIDRRPRVTVVGSHRRSIASVLRFGWRVRVRCTARCAVRLRLLAARPGEPHRPIVAGHARVALTAAGTRTVRVAVRPTLRRGLRARRSVRFRLEVTSVAAVPALRLKSIALTAARLLSRARQA